MADICSPLRVDNDDVVLLTPAVSKGITAVLVNSTDKDQKVSIRRANELDLQPLEILDSGNNRISCEEAFVMLKGSYLKVLRRYDSNENRT